MANYLPVLLYSVGSNAAPDDSSLLTLPRGQVDYLTHDWQEEDVWRSWRNMTRQKNEIANGVRLENASWRTWWKQRNKLKTVSPETLNWLKDSDVTWLYGPLHTAVEWTPPPKPKPDETDHKPASVHDRFDLSEPKHKSILKYRSISEMLTSDLPSPLFSPAESENESDGNENLSREGSDASVYPSRPSLSHTKSDTHIIRWGPNRAFRKASPPRVEPTGAIQTVPNSTASHTSAHHVYSATNLSGYFASHIQGHNAQAELSSSSPSPKGGSSEVTPSGGAHSNGHKKKHITFNTFVEQCIAIDQPKPKDTTFAAVVNEVEDDWYARNHDPVRTNYDDGYDEDGEDGFDGDWGLNECAISTDSESDADQMPVESACDDDDDDEGVIQMRSRRDSFDNKNNARLRSTSKVSNSSSSSSASSGDYSSSASSNRKNIIPNIRRRRRSDGPKHISLPRKGSSSLARNSSSTALSSSEKEMVSIAPIAPTILKTGSQTTWDGFGIHSVQSPYGLPPAWSEGFGDDFSDDGGNMHVGPGGAKLYFGHSSESQESTPVGLVYMPPATSRYSSARLPRANSNTSLDSEAEVELREDINQKDADDLHGDKNVGSEKDERSETGDKMFHHREAYLSIGSDKEGVLGVRSSSVPIVVRTPPAVQLVHGNPDDDGDLAEEDAYDYFGGPDLGEDFALRKTTSSARRKPPRPAVSSQVTIEGANKSQAVDIERQSRSRSRSRTPSPSYVSQSSTSAISVPAQAEHISSSSSSSALLSPPQPGRELITAESPSTSRGRPSRTSSTFSDRSRSHSNHSSPLGSLSPEGIGSAYSANGRGGGDRERDRERSNRGGGRGRERTERRLTHSVSPDAVESVSSLGPDAPSSVCSSSSGSQTVVAQQPESSESVSTVDHYSAEASRSLHPTPANSPVISMSSAAHAIAQMNGKSPISIPDPHVTSPRLSYPTDATTEPANGIVSLPSSSSDASLSIGGSSDGGASVVGKAVGMVSSAGAYLGFWNNGTTA
ncbi:hypothetical protein DFH05DRAFT_1525965 [Lentinula detonsa]|uniref:Nitrogen regulatory protein areA GATA-like domain-containing protein n=1 Tax=Lentinula detonsa TaxID=2804962 RepID=A0A9W8NZ32_9AGAR|nr:hypothetical protein DFH05DRAFT_1525965 [Lentinula detonsa]